MKGSLISFHMFTIPMYFLKFGLPKFMWAFTFEQTYGGNKFNRKTKNELSHFGCDTQVNFLLWRSGPELCVLSTQDFTQESLRALKGDMPQSCASDYTVKSLERLCLILYMQKIEYLKKQELLTAWRCKKARAEILKPLPVSQRN